MIFYERIGLILPPPAKCLIMLTEDAMAKKLTKEIEAQVIHELSLGDRSLRQICASLDVALTTFLDRCDNDPLLAEQYTRARQRGTDLAFDRLTELQNADPVRVDGRVDPGWAQYRRLQIDTLKWELSKRAPRKYGERIQTEISGPDGGAVKAEVKIEFVGGE